MGVDPEELEYVAQKLERSKTPISAQIVRDAAAKIEHLRGQLEVAKAQRDIETTRANNLASIIRAVPEALALWHERNDIVPAAE